MFCVACHRTGKLIAAAPEKLVTPQQRIVDGAPKRLPPQRRIRSVQVRQKGGARIVVTTGVGKADINIGGFAQVLVTAEVSYHTHIFAVIGLEHLGRIATENLSRTFEEPVLRTREDAGNGNTRIVDSIFAAQQIHGRKRPVNVIQRMVVNGIHLAEGSTHFAHSSDESFGQRGECDVTLFYVHALLAEREKKVATSVRVNDGLHT